MMLHRSLVTATVLAALLLGALPAQADPGHTSEGIPGSIVTTTDDPSGDETTIGLDGAASTSIQRFLGSQPPATRAQRTARNISLVGAYRGAEFNQGVFADTAGYQTATRRLAFLGKWRSACPGSGVDIIDVSNPAKPVKLANTPTHVNTSMEKMEALRIGTRDVLAIGLQDCGNQGTAGKSGLELVDITNPVQPQLLSFFDVDQFGADVVGVHELHLTTTPSGRALALLSVPDIEALTSDDQGKNGTGDLLIVDITDPVHPTLAGEWGVLDAPELGLDFYLSVRQGGDARTLLHSPRPNADGTRAYLSYWDAGVIILDISNPASPRYLGRTTYGPNDEGNAHSTADARDGTLLVQADEDFSPFHLEFNITAPLSIAGQYPAVEGAFTKPIVSLPGKLMSGDVVYVGRGCPGVDTYLANPAGKIALIERGLCRFDNKIARAQQAGAIGAIVFNSVAGGESLVLMGGDNPVVVGDPSVIGTQITIPGIFVRRSTGLKMVDALSAGQTVSVTAKAVFDGWGFLRLFDISNPASPVPLSTFATANTFNEAVATSGIWSVHNPQIRGSTIYASWYSDGVRVIDISLPKQPREIGSWTGAGAPSDAPAVDIWSVVPFGDVLLASDRNYGLYVLKLAP